MKWLNFLTRLLISALLLASISIASIPSPALAVACRDIPSVQQSADADQNTAMGGHVTQHIYGMQPPPNTSQKDKTLFEAKGKYEAVWRQYKYIANPVNCSGTQEQQTVPLNKLGISYLGAYSCTQANANGEWTKWDSYMAREVFFGFIRKDSTWILNTAFPTPETQ